MSNELKATKGPWAAIDHGVGELVVYSKDTEDAICVLDDTDERYAWKKGYSTSKEAKANAHLIAAAPGLYRELEYFHSWACGEFATYESSEAGIRVASVLAKSRGEGS